MGGLGMGDLGPVGLGMGSAGGLGGPLGGQIGGGFNSLDLSLGLNGMNGGGPGGGAMMRPEFGAFPLVKLRGLPFQANEQDILAFLVRV